MELLQEPNEALTNWLEATPPALAVAVLVTMGVLYWKRQIEKKTLTANDYTEAAVRGMVLGVVTAVLMLVAKSR